VLNSDPAITDITSRQFSKILDSVHSKKLPYLDSLLVPLVK